MPSRNTSPEAKPWDRRSGEKPEWYRRFLVYLQLDPGQRSVDAVWQALGGRGPAPTSWHQAAQSFDWEARAQAYDQAGRPPPEGEPIPSVNELARRILHIIATQIGILEEKEELTDRDVARLSRLVRALMYLSNMAITHVSEEEIIVKFD